MPECMQERTTSIPAVNLPSAALEQAAGMPTNSPPSLPTEVVLVILSKLDAPSLLQATLVCRHWYRLASQYRQSLWHNLAIQDFTFTAPRAYWKLELRPEPPDVIHSAKNAAANDASLRHLQRQYELDVAPTVSNGDDGERGHLPPRHLTAVKEKKQTDKIPNSIDEQGSSTNYRQDWKALYQQTSNWYRGRARGYHPLILPPATSSATGAAAAVTTKNASHSSDPSSSKTTPTTNDIVSWLLKNRTPEAIVGLQHEGSASSSISLTQCPAAARAKLDHQRVILRSNPHYRRHVPRNSQAGSSSSHHPQQQAEERQQPNIMVQDPSSQEKITFAISSAKSPAQTFSEQYSTEPPSSSSETPLSVSGGGSNSPSPTNASPLEPTPSQPLHSDAEPMNDIVCHYSSPHHSMIVTGHMDGSVRLWDLSIDEPGQQCIRSWQTTARRRVLCVGMNTRVVVSGNDDSTICVWDIHPDPSKSSPSHGTIHSASYLTSAIPGLDDWVVGIEHICVGDSLVACSTESSGSVLVFSLATGSLVYEIPGLYQPSKICMTEFFLLTGGRGAWNQGATRDRRTHVVEHHHPQQHQHATLSPTATTPTIEMSMMEADLAWSTTGSSSPASNNGSTLSSGGPTFPQTPYANGFEPTLPNGWWAQVQLQQHLQQHLHMRNHPQLIGHQGMRAPAVEEYTTCCINVWDLRTGQRLYSLIPRLFTQPSPTMSVDEILLHSIKNRSRRRPLRAKGDDIAAVCLQSQGSHETGGKGKQVQERASTTPLEEECKAIVQGETNKAHISTTCVSPNLTLTTASRQSHQQGTHANEKSHVGKQHGAYPRTSLPSQSPLSPPIHSSSATWSSSSFLAPLTASNYSTPGYGSNPRRASTVTSIVIPGSSASSGDGRFASSSSPMSSRLSSVGATSHYLQTPHINNNHQYQHSPPNQSAIRGIRLNHSVAASSSSSLSPKTPASPILRPLTLLDMTVSPDHSTLIVAVCERWGQGREGVYAWDFSGTRLEGYHDDGEDEDEEDEEGEEGAEGQAWDDNEYDARGEDKYKGQEEETDQKGNSPTTSTTPTSRTIDTSTPHAPPSILEPPPELKGLRMRKNDMIMQQVSSSAFADFHHARITGKVWVCWKNSFKKT